MKHKKGFTLTEMMVVVLILAGLAAISYPLYTKVITKARTAEALSLIEIVREAQQRNLTVKGRYFSRFSTPQVTGRTRLIKAGGVKVERGELKKGLYTVTIADSKTVESGCIIVKYGPKTSSPVFTIYSLVEDSKMWCEEADEANGICSILPIEEDKNECK